MILADTHTHLYLKEFDADRSEVVRSGILKGIRYFFLPNIDSETIPALFGLCKEFPANCFPMIGLHPCSVNNKYGDELHVVEYWLTQRKFSAIGEIGIDLHWDKTFINQQKDAFAQQVELAKKYDLPVVIHTRDSFDVAYEIVAGLNSKKLKGIFHCFTGKKEDAEKVIALGGFKMGIGGVVTFKNSGLAQLVSEIDLDYFVLETDSPYLAPVPFRGKRNESGYLPIIAEKIAEIKKIPIEEVARITTQNALAVFSL